MRFDGFVNIIMEAMEQPYPYRYKNSEDGYIFYPDPQNKNIFYSVILVRYNEDGDYEPLRGNVLEIAFRYNNKQTEEYDVMDTQSPAAGNVFRILATIKAIVHEYFTKKQMNKITQIIFTSKPSERGKTSLYKRLLQQISDYMGPNWKTEIGPGTGDQKGYVLFKAYKS
jgi:hypothetical protein